MYVFQFLKRPRVDIHITFVVLAEVHEFLSVVVLVQDVLSQVALLGLAVILH